METSFGHESYVYKHRNEIISIIIIKKTQPYRYQRNGNYLERKPALTKGNV